MPEAAKLCVVDDVMFVKGRGLVISTSLWQGITVRINDWVELRSTGGASNFAKIKSIDMVRWPPSAGRVAGMAGRYAFTLSQIHRGAVKQGDEVWSVVEPLAEVSQKQ